MNDLSVGIIGAARERHCIYLSRELERQGVRPVLLDNSPDLPFPLSMHRGESYYGELSLEHTTVYFLRALFLPTPAFDASPISGRMEEEGHVAYAAERERYAAWLSWLKSAPLHNRHIVNPVDTLLLHFAKPFQVESLRRNHIPVPDTLVTSDAGQLLRFSRNRQVVYKPVAGGALCKLLTEQDLQDGRLEALSTAPVQFQEYIEGRDLRVFVLDGKIVSAFLVEGEGIDYRAGETRLEPFELRPDIAELCIRACDCLGLLFSGVDLKLREDGSVIVIECNPSPMFEGFDQAGPISVVERLAAYLIDRALQLRGAAVGS